MKPNRRPLVVRRGERSVICRFAGVICRQAVAVVCLALLILSGCGQGDRPPLGTVHGTVTLDGRPLAGASLAFQPVELGRASVATTDSDGKYELLYIRQEKGAKVGTHQVRISATNRDKSQLLPPRYNTQSVLRADVKSGDNTIDFPLATR